MAVKMPVAGAQELACELLEIGIAKIGSWSATNQFDLIFQWPIAGKT